MERIKSISELKQIQEKLAKGRDPGRPLISVCGGTGCRASGCKDVVKALTESLEAHKLKGKVDLRVTGCQGFCERGPLLVIRPKGIFYQLIEPKDVDEIVTSFSNDAPPIERLLYKSPIDKRTYVKEEDVPFYKHQQKIISGLNGFIDPTSIEDYLALGGYTALSTCLRSIKPEAIIDMIIKSGLRGRGGGGFPTGVKWKSCRDAGERKNEKKRYVLCNADEGDPGAFMDCSLLEGNPHSVIEGMIIGAFAIGSDEGYVYIRHEYPMALRTLTTAIAQAREAGLLGKNILGTDFSFDMKINRGGGAFVCGESTALMASIEGFVGEPRAKHIHTVEAGLYEKPSNLNNVETWANVPVIINRGVGWYTSIGTGDVSKDPWGGSKGTKIFSLVGKVNNTGLVEVPMGMSLRKIIYDVGGGIKADKKFKAVQTGGPSGGCIPSTLLDLPVDFDELTKVGSMMGSGGMIVMDEDTCMVDVAKYFTSFLAKESCGKCVTCREGLIRMSEILGRITDGGGWPGDLELIERVSKTIAEASMCALGGFAPNPVMSTLKYFRDEYETHINKKKCPAHVCKALIRFDINDKCSGCTLCARNCPVSCIAGKKNELHVIDQAKCIRCWVCREVCKFQAVDVD
ncbi:MAG: NADH-ubiquinone oxidoreductase-F iron-sulfur binding region domain-containing protein [Deltaproteobacteria bacterium]|nr:NADH-ubiquinone oxidoreductase-F iron-sulfur binding region domain-containing protein [Deltaproteobacteria bacterium]